MKTKANTAAPPAQAECTICLSNDSPDVGVLKCKHAFCFACIESWSEHENSCPLCKVRFTFIDRFVTSPNEPNKPAKSRVKIKKRNQGDYDYTHPSPATSQGETADIALWANFIAGLTGQNNIMSAFLNGRDDEDYVLAQNRRFGARVVPARRYEREGDFLSSAEFRFDRNQLMRRTLTARPAQRATVRTHGSQAQPIELSDDENTSSRQASSSSSSSSSSSAAPTRAPTLAGSSASNAVDLIDLTDDTEDPPALSIDTSASLGTAAAHSQSRLDASRRAFTLSASSSPGSLVHIPQPHSVSSRQLHPAASMSSFGNYSLMDFLSDDEDDEDYEPPMELEIDAERDDNSQVSDDTPAQNEVIDLNDSDSEDLGNPVTSTVPSASSVPVATASAPNRASTLAGQSIVALGANAPRLSGIMVWCRDCDSYHDKQRVYDDAGYCPATYASLVSSDGFADICQDPPTASARGVRGRTGASSSSARSSSPAGRVMPSSATAARDAGEAEAEWTSDDSTTSEQWHSRNAKSHADGTVTRSGSPSGSEWGENNEKSENYGQEGKEVKEDDLSRTQSDATTSSSRSRSQSMSLSRRDTTGEVRTQPDDEDLGELTQTQSFQGVPRSLSTKSVTTLSSAPMLNHSNKRTNWISYMLEGEDGEEGSPSGRRTKQRTEGEDGIDDLLEAKA